jgi:hypothetical protein
LLQAREFADEREVCGGELPAVLHHEPRGFAVGTLGDFDTFAGEILCVRPLSAVEDSWFLV